MCAGRMFRENPFLKFKPVELACEGGFSRNPYWNSSSKQAQASLNAVDLLTNPSYINLVCRPSLPK